MDYQGGGGEHGLGAFVARAYQAAGESLGSLGESIGSKGMNVETLSAMAEKSHHLMLFLRGLMSAFSSFGLERALHGASLASAAIANFANIKNGHRSFK